MNRNQDQSPQKEPGKPAATGKAKPIPLWKKLVFSLVTVVLIFGILELLLILFDVRPKTFTKDPYVGFAKHVPLFVKRTGPDSRKWMTLARNKALYFNAQKFPVDKGGDTFRIFCLGGSTTYGRPYNDSTSFAGWLRRFLPEADPTRSYEVINGGGISYASYRVALLMEELIEYEPDLFIIYTGHNEFLEKRTYDAVIEMPPMVRGMDALLSRFRLFSALKSLARGSAGSGNKDSSKVSLLPEEIQTRFENSIGPEAYHRDDTLTAQVSAHFRYNLARMVEMARSSGAGVILVTPASNLRNCSPFKSEPGPGMSAEDTASFQALMDQGEETRKEGRPEEALAALDRAAALDDRYAHLHYARGRALWALERFDEARTAFRRARDEDVCPLRALTPLCEAVREVSAERDAPLVDYLALVEGWSEHGVPGESLFLDHVHPTIEGHRRLALALVEETVRLAKIETSPQWNEETMARITTTFLDSLDETTHGMALRNLSMVLSWAGKFEEACSLAEEATRMAPQDSMAYFQLGACAIALGEVDRAIAAFRKSIRIMPKDANAHALLGGLLDDKGQRDEAIRHLRAAVQLNPQKDDARLRLAYLLAGKEKYKEAISHMERYLAGQPQDGRARQRLNLWKKKLGLPVDSGPGW